MPFFPNSSLYSKNYPRNINHMPAVIFFVCLDFGKNCYSRTASESGSGFALRAQNKSRSRWEVETKQVPFMVP